MTEVHTEAVVSHKEPSGLPEGAEWSPRGSRGQRPLKDLSKTSQRPLKDLSKTSQTTLETLPRAKESNPLNLTDLEFAQMKKEVKELSEKYPELPIGMIRQAWMFHYIKYVK